MGLLLPKKHIDFVITKISSNRRLHIDKIFSLDLNLKYKDYRILIKEDSEYLAWLFMVKLLEMLYEVNNEFRNHFEHEKE